MIFTHHHRWTFQLHFGDLWDQWENMSLLRCPLTGALATACGDDAVRVFKEDATADPDQPVFSLAAQVTRAHNQDVNCVAWNPKEAGLLVSCSDDGDISIWRFHEEDWALITVNLPLA